MLPGFDAAFELLPIPGAGTRLSPVASPVAVDGGRVSVPPASEPQRGRLGTTSERLGKPH